MRRWYEWKSIPSAPPIRSIEIVVVPKLSNLANPYGYRAEGGLQDSLQQNRVTKSHSKSVSRPKTLRMPLKNMQKTYHLMSDPHLR